MSGIFVNVGSLSRYGRRNGSLSRRLTGLNPLARATWLLFNNGVLSPLVTATRSGTATFFDSTGTLQNAAANTPRVSYDPANLSLGPFLLAEEERTNSIRNNTMQGAVAGAPGTFPTNWSELTVAGVTRSILAVSSEDGIPYIDVRIAGTPTTTANYSIRAEQTNQIVASSEQLWTGSFFARVIAGTIGGANPRVLVNERTAVGGFIGSTVTPLVAAGNLRSARTAVTRTVSASGGRVDPSMIVSCTKGVPIDITLRIGLPQLELGATASSPILTFGSAVTRSADNLPVTNLAATGFNASEGTIYCAWARDSASGAATGGAASVPRIWALGTASAGLMQLRPFSENSLEFVGSPNGSSLYVASSPWSQSGINKTACAYAVDNCAAVTNSGVVGTDATVGSFSGLGIDRLALGANVTGNSPLQGRIYQAAIIPQRVSDSALQRLTRI